MIFNRTLRIYLAEKVTVGRQVIEHLVCSKAEMRPLLLKPTEGEGERESLH